MACCIGVSITGTHSLNFDRCTDEKIWSLPGMAFEFRCTAFVGITVDGYIARSNGSIDYLPPAPTTDPSAHPVCKVPTITDMLGMCGIEVDAVQNPVS